MPVKNAHWLKLEREAAELVASRFSFTWVPSLDPFDRMDGHFYKDDKPAFITEIKASDYRPRFFHQQGFIRLNGEKVRRGRAASIAAGLPFLVVFYTGGKGVFVWRVTDAVGIDEINVKFIEESRPLKWNGKKGKKEIAFLYTKEAFFFVT